MTQTKFWMSLLICGGMVFSFGEAEAREYSWKTAKRFEYSLVMLKETVHKLIDSNQKLKLKTVQIEQSLDRMQDEIDIVEAELGKEKDVDSAVDRVIRSEALALSVFYQQKEDIQLLNQEVLTYQDQLNELQAEEIELTRRADKIKEKLQIVPEPLKNQNQDEAGHQEVTEAQQKLVFLIEQSRDNIQRLQNIVEQYEAGNDSDIEEDNRWRSEYNHLQAQIKSLNKQYESAVEEEAGIKESIDTIKSENQNQTEELQEIIRAYELRKKKLSLTLGEAESKLTQNQLDLTSDQDSIERLRENLSELKQEQKSLQEEINKLDQ